MKLKFTEVHYYEKGGSEYFEKELVPLLKKVEKHRTDSLNKFIVAAILCVIVNIVIFVYFFSNFEDYETGCTIILIDPDNDRFPEVKIDIRKPPPNFTELTDCLLDRMLQNFAGLVAEKDIGEIDINHI